MSAGPAMPVNRRSFLKLSALAGGGLALGYFFRPDGPARGEVASPAANAGFRPSAFLRIGVDGTVTIQSARPEMGQGVRTSLPMIVAEELGADWRRVAVESAPLDPVYGGQAAGGSRSTPDSYGILRRVGATARVLLVRAAAQAWGVSPAECAAKDGTVRHRPSGRTLRFGALAEAAARLPVPPEAEVELRDPRTFTLLGSRIGGVDNPKVVTGQPLSELRRVLRKYPQSATALQVGEKRPLDQLATVGAVIRAVESELGERGRVLVRYSGTEPKIRLMVEGEDATHVKSCLARLEAAVRADLPAG